MRASSAGHAVALQSDDNRTGARVIPRQLVILYAGLALIVVLVIPVPVGPWVLTGGATPRPDTAPRCLALEIAYSTWAPRRLPTAMRLRSTPSEYGRHWFNAEGRLREGFPAFAIWRTAGTDSIDITWHHAPLIRIPTPPVDSSSRVVGRLTSTWATSLVTRASFRDAPVIARSIPCEQFDSRFLGERQPVAGLPDAT
jgi:hypothetical protein